MTKRVKYWCHIDFFRLYVHHVHKWWWKRNRRCGWENGTG